ncbi:MAG: InlB B-repeat-containing protein [Clostridia bacterium]|nr:InlB B-repeat-containing protein [Clostridia bacterium]
MQRGTQVPLEYNIETTLTNKPTNLVFYSNSEKTEALIIENEKNLNFNGYFSLASYKKRYIPIYWEWKFETGDTQEEIRKNNVIDTSFMTKTMSMEIDATGEQVTQKSAGNYRARFNANGGVFPQYGNAKTTTRQVINGEQYGDVPTPTREGYRFVGWSVARNASMNDDNLNVYAIWAEI